MAAVPGAACRADGNFCPRELMWREGVWFVFLLCQASVTQLRRVFVPQHLKTVVLRCSAKHREMRTVRCYEGEEEGTSKEDGRFVCPAFFCHKQKKWKWPMFVFTMYIYLNWFCTIMWADSARKIHISSLAVCAGSAVSSTVQILAPLLLSAKLRKSHFD